MTSEKTEIKINELESSRLNHLFGIALSNYTFDSNIEIKLTRTSIKGSTMQAQPIFGFREVFTGLHKYRIRLAKFVRGSETMVVEELPDDVLIGWFAHELGHVKDYENHSFLGMIWFGLRYITSSSFRKKIEHRADQIAIEHGYHKEVLATKKFLFTHEDIDPTYRTKIKKFYMPMRDVEDWIEKNISIDPVD
tara:strand:- start:55143 stop:55721 length:579 start_codon:yes stop_codon:yes gene_type:complete